MIKKLQKLKAKKGFTLVELIVVIAIIGVLAAILVPTMLGYVQSSRITSADQVAKTIKDAAQVCATEMDTLGNGLKSKTVIAYGKYTSGDHTVVLTKADGTALTGDNIKIGDDTDSTKDYKGMDPNSAKAASKHASKLINSLQTLLTESKDGAFVVVYTNGTCTQAYWSEDAAVKTLADSLNATTGLIKSSGEGDGWSTTPGILSSGNQIVGSSPKFNG